MEERNMPRRPRREKADDQPRNESLVYGKNPVTELLKSGSGVDTVLLAGTTTPNCIRSTFRLEGTPIILSIREKGDKEE